MENNPHIPFYTKFSQVAIGIIAFMFMLYVGGDIIVPIIFATIIAILLNPIVNYLHGKKLNRVIAIIIALLIGVILLGGIIYFIVWQASRFSDSIPGLKVKFNELATQSVAWASDVLNIPAVKINDWIAKLRTEGGQNTSKVIGQTLSTVSSVFLVAFLLPVYTFTILYYKPLFLQFFSRVFPPSNHKTVAEILIETKGLIQSYLLGLLIESAIVSTMNAVGLLIIGVKYAILLGLIGGILNMIPYIGGIVAVALPMVMALATQSPVAALWVMALYVVVQFIDNQYITPYVVASKVKINAFISIIVVLIGGALWGIAGMFLSIPLVAIAKVIFDRIDNLKPIGLLLGDDMPDEDKSFFLFPQRRQTVKKIKAKVAAKSKKAEN